MAMSLIVAGAVVGSLELLKAALRGRKGDVYFRIDEGLILRCRGSHIEYSL